MWILSDLTHFDTVGGCVSRKYFFWANFGWYSFVWVWDMYIRPIGSPYAHFFKIFSPQVSLTNAIPCTKFLYYVLIWSLAVAFYKFSLNVILWVPTEFIACTDRWTDRRSLGIQLVLSSWSIIYIYGIYNAISILICFKW